MRQTKIIATVGPASDSDEGLDALIAAGTDIVRLNFSHGTHETHAATVRRVRSAAERAGRTVAILQDLGGPKIRTGLLEGGRPIRLDVGSELEIVTGSETGRPGRVSTTFDGLAPNVTPGERLLLADGVIELEVLATDGITIRTRVVEGGMLGEHKGINAPGVPLSASAVTLKDMEDLQFGLSIGVDLVALSFVQSAADVRRARQIIHDNNSDVPLIAKIERPQALEHLDEILAATDMVMVARGDLGLEMPLAQVPRAQKTIVRHARACKVPVILATQVLESMTVEARPTRAEVSDAAHAVEDGVDGIMLSGETASGVHPARVVQMLDAIIREAESGLNGGRLAIRRYSPEHDHTQAICDAAVTLAERGRADAIVAVTRGGSTARQLSSLRPMVPIIATTDREDLARRLCPYWGVVPVCTEIGEGGGAGELIAQQLLAHGRLKHGATVVLVSVSTDLTRTDANYLKIHRL